MSNTGDIKFLGKYVRDSDVEPIGLVEGDWIVSEGYHRTKVYDSKGDWTGNYRIRFWHDRHGWMEVDPSTVVRLETDEEYDSHTWKMHDR